MKITIYTDGACRGNPGPGGLGIVMIAPEMDYRQEYSRAYRLTTNNRMELMALIAALEKLKGEGHEIELFSDSSYVVHAIEKGWLRDWIKKDFKDKKNRDLWLRYAGLAKKHKIKAHWVKGHDNNPENERCDRLAVEACMKDFNSLQEDIGYKNEAEGTKLF